MRRVRTASAVPCPAERGPNALTHGGTLIQQAPEGLTAVFGGPVAQEDHARRAVLAALDLQQRLAQHPTLRPPALGAGLALGIGIHSGLGVVGELGPVAHRQVTVVGAPAQGALRLQQQAAPGALLVSAATYHLVQEEVRGEPCGNLALEGWQAPLRVYAVQGLVRRGTLACRGVLAGRRAPCKASTPLKAGWGRNMQEAKRYEDYTLGTLGLMRCYM